MKKALVAIAVIAGMGYSTQPASAQFCAAGIVFAAFYAHATANRELSATEASTCGLLYGAGVKPAAEPKAKKPRKTAAKAKAQ